MAETAALLVDDILPRQPVRQWVLSAKRRYLPLWTCVMSRCLVPRRDNGIDREAAFELIRTLLERGADPNAQVQHVLPVKRWIIRFGKLSWVDITGQTAFFRAAYSGDVSTMKLLIEHGAANRGSDDIIRWLAANGARLDVADGVGRTAVDWAHGICLRLSATS